MSVRACRRKGKRSLRFELIKGKRALSLLQGKKKGKEWMRSCTAEKEITYLDHLERKGSREEGF